MSACMEFLAHPEGEGVEPVLPAGGETADRRHLPLITVTFVNGVEVVFDATSTSAQHIRSTILDKGQVLETEQMFRDAGGSWPVLIPEAELLQTNPGTKPRRRSNNHDSCFRLGRLVDESRRPGLDQLHGELCLLLKLLLHIKPSLYYFLLKVSWWWLLRLVLEFTVAGVMLPGTPRTLKSSMEIMKAHVVNNFLLA